MSSTATRAQYDEAFALEASQAYPMIDELETRLGYALDRVRLEAAARVLACPVKRNAPCWQHGRVLYALTRARLASWAAIDGPVTLLDIGTAKGFSALCLQWALDDSGAQGVVWSVDVIDPLARVTRNTVAEVDGLQSLLETLEPWPEAGRIRFLQSTGEAWLKTTRGRLAVAFVDGKHTREAVAREAALLEQRQDEGDVVLFDDVQLPPVAEAVQTVADTYALKQVRPLAHRAYTIGVRR